jgi:hypothetical protein
MQWGQRLPAHAATAPGRLGWAQPSGDPTRACGQRCPHAHVDPGPAGCPLATVPQTAQARSAVESHARCTTTGTRAHEMGTVCIGKMNMERTKLGQHVIILSTQAANIACSNEKREAGNRRQQQRAMQLPCNSHATPMQLPRNSHATPMQLPCNSHATPTQLPCNSHSTPMHSHLGRCSCTDSEPESDTLKTSESKSSRRPWPSPLR